MTWMSRLAGGAFALAVSCVVTASALAGGPSAPPAQKNWLAWHEAGGFLSTERHRAESNLFAPIWQSSKALLFFLGTGKLFEDDIREGNFALGLRKMHRSDWNFGLWGGYDVRSSEEDNVFHQIAFGAEALSDRWDVRANGYVAVSDPELSPGAARVTLTGPEISMIGGREVPLSGFDGEVGYKVFSGRGGPKDGSARHGRSHELRVFAGGFYFDDGEALEEVVGPRARIEWRIVDVVHGLPGSRLTLGGAYQYDDVREDQWEGGVRFRVPFGGGGRDARATHLASLTPQERRMTESIVRDTDIVTAASEEENVFDVLTGVRFDRAAVLAGGGSLQQTIDASGPNSLIVVDGGVSNGSFALGSSQTLQGGGSTIRVTGVKSGVTMDFTAPGARPFLVQTLNQAVLTVDSNTHVAGLGIRGAGGTPGRLDNDGIAAMDGIANVAITDSMLMDLGGDGISFLDNHANVTVSHNTISGTGGHGVRFGGDNSAVRVSHNAISGTDGDGVRFGNDNSTVRVSGNTVSDTRNNGVRFDDNNSTVTVSHNTISGAGASGVRFSNRNSAVTLSDNTISDSFISGVHFDDDNSAVTVSGNTISSSLSGVFFNDDNSAVTVSDNTVSDTRNNGVFFVDNNSAITVSNNRVSDTDGDGVRFDDNNSAVTVSNNTVSGTTRDGVRFVNDNSAVTVSHNTISGAGAAGARFSNRNSAVTVSDNTISGTGEDGVRFGGDNSAVTVSDNTVSGTTRDGVRFINDNSAVTVSGNTISDAGFAGMFFAANNSAVTVSDNTISDVNSAGMLFFAVNTNLLLSNNSFSGIDSDLFDFGAGANTLAAGSSGNVVDDAPGGFLCQGGFTGTLEITDENGVLQTFTNSC